MRSEVNVEFERHPFDPFEEMREMTAISGYGVEDYVAGYNIEVYKVPNDIEENIKSFMENHIETFIDEEINPLLECYYGLIDNYFQNTMDNTFYRDGRNLIKEYTYLVSNEFPYIDKDFLPRISDYIGDKGRFEIDKKDFDKDMENYFEVIEGNEDKITIMYKGKLPNT